MAEKLEWQEAVVTDVVVQSPSAKSFFLKPPHWHGFIAGQHVDVRLTAPDGYQAERSYSIASAPEAGDTIELVVDKLSTGEVSPYFHEVVMPGDTIELRGPIGGHFNWTREQGGPLLLVGGGSGVVPLMSILRHRAVAAPEIPALLVYSVRHWADVIFRDELMRRAEKDPNFMLILTVTRETPPESARAGRVDAGLIAEVLGRFDMHPRHSFICGANAFVGAASRYLLDAGVPFGTIKTERYGGEDAGVAPVAPAAPAA